MTPERWARVKEILGAALEMPESERNRFLDGACGSEAWLREEVERLLAAQDPHSFTSPVGGVLSAAEAAELTPGQRLGHYRVELKLGQGGMGAVYKAWDEQLQRPVGLKVLSSQHFADSAGRHRFLREARASSALNHPNIVTVYEVGSERGVDFIAMEYIEGRTLDRLIPAKGLPLKQALDYSIAIAAALAKAHAAGIVHRDLKPGNIMVTGDGLVKLLDFGLARRVRLPDTATTAPLTREGEIIGTPAYMSPEQAEGKMADERSDVFSFGVVLYEMVSGSRAFTGDSNAAILGAVLTAEPPRLRGVPAALEKLISQCLHKDAALRLQHIDDVRLILDDIRRDASKLQPTRAGRGRRAAIVAAVVACFSLALWFVSIRGKPPAAAMASVQLTSLPGVESHPSFSPDGGQVAFTWNGWNQDNYDVYLKVVGSVAAPLRLTTDAARDVYPAWSPDGRQIAFVRAGEPSLGLYLISALGGPERKLADFRSPHSQTQGGVNALGWSPDARWLAFSEEQPDGSFAISLISVERGDKRKLTSNGGVPHAVAFSPDGRYLAYASCPSLLAPACDIYLLEMGPGLSPRGQPRRLTYQNVYILGLAWTQDGRSLIYSGSRCPGGAASLWRTGVSGSGAPERVDVAGTRAELPAISRSGRLLAYVRDSTDADLWTFQVGGSAAAKLPSSTLDEHNPQFSPDGKRIAFVSDRSGGCPEIWVSDREGSSAVQLTSEGSSYQGTPRWSPDGRWIAWDGYGADGHADIYVMDADGGQQRRLTPFPSDESVPSWSRDGKWIYFRSNRNGSNEIWKMPFEGGPAVQVTDNGGYVVFESWDGKILYYLKDSLPGPLFGRPVAGGSERQIIPDSIQGRAFYPAEDGIYYIERGKDSGPNTLRFYQFASGRTQELTTITGVLRLGLTVSRDRKIALFSVAQEAAADLMLIENFQ